MKAQLREREADMETACMIVCVLLAIICGIYGMIVWATGSGTGFFFVWFGMAVLFVCLGFFLYLRLWGKIPGFLQKVILVLAAAGILVFLVVEGLIISQMNQNGKADLDYILVLGAQVREDGPSVALKYRLDKAVEYLEENPDTLCIVSGGQGYNEPFPEAEGMASYLLEKGIQKERLILEADSKTTAENIANSKKFIEKGASVGILTNDFHMFRALQIARSQKLENICGIAAGSSKLYLPNNMFREFFAEIKYLMKESM